MEAPRQKGLLPTRPKLKENKKKFSKTKVISNHYRFNIRNMEKNEALFFRSWTLSFDVKSDEKTHKDDEVLPIEKDARELHDRIMLQMRHKIRSKIGYFIISGQLIYAIDSECEDYFVIPNENGPNLILQKNPDKIDLNSLFLGFKRNSEILKLCNLVLKAKFKQLNMVELGRLKKYYEPKPVRKVCGNIAFLIMKGFSSSILPYESGLLLQLDYSTRIMREKSIWNELRSELNGNYYRKDFERFVEDRIIGRSFILKHANHRIVRIDLVDEKMKITDAFPNKNFKNYADYFLKRYQHKLGDRDQLMCCEFTKNYQFDRKSVTSPSDIMRDRRGEYVRQENWYPSELLTPCGLTDDMVKDFKIMREIATETKKSPLERSKLNSNKIAQLSGSDSGGSKQSGKLLDFASKLKLEIDEKSNTQEALLFTPPMITFGKKAKITLKLDRSNFNMKKPIFDKKRSMSEWAFIYDDSKGYYVEECVNKLGDASKSFEIKLGHPSPVYEVDGRNIDPAELYDLILQKNKKVKLVFFFVNRRNNFYNDVKQYFSEKKMLTQFFVNYNPQRPPNLSVYSKLVLQMMAKLGKELWRVERGLYSDKGSTSMMIGIDLIRFKKGHLISATATMNRQFSKFYNQCGYVTTSTKQSTKDHNSNCISQLIKKCVKQYIKKNEKTPQNVIVYRSGYGNARHLQDEIGYEATLIKDQLKKIDKSGDLCRLLYLCVNKRMDDRFFVKNGGNKVHNPKGGLMIVSRVTQKERFDFFMVAQQVTQGCAMPTHYFSIFNDTSLSADEIYSLTYYQTFNYFNWQGPVRVPAVCKYAEKQLELVAAASRRVKNPMSIKNAMPSKIFYL